MLAYKKTDQNRMKIPHNYGVFGDYFTCFSFLNSGAIMTYHSTIPSPTALNRSSVFGFIGITCLQSGSFSRALFIQFTKAYFSSSKITNYKFNTGFFTTQQRFTQNSLQQPREKKIIIKKKHAIITTLFYQTQFKET